MKLRILLYLFACGAVAANINPRQKSPEAACSALLKCNTASREVSIDSAVYVPAGSLNITDLKATNNASFCRVTAVVPYGHLRTKPSKLNFEVWLPDTTLYNGRYLSVGNGGFAGVIDYQSMLSNLENGYAVAGGDSGHLLSKNSAEEPGGYLPYFHNRDQTLAWIRNSIAMFTVPSKSITNSYYEKPVKYSYYSGCSTGGGQGFALALHYPTLFDGIYAGSPGNFYSRLMISFLWNYLKSLGTGFLPQAALDFVTDAVLAECDEIDGVKDGIIEDPLKCNFNVTSLQCAPSANSIVNNQTVCLTPDQLKTVEAFYAGPKDLRNGNQLYTGFSFGSEFTWAVQEGDVANAYATPLMGNLVYNNTAWRAEDFNFASNVDDVDTRAAPYIDHSNPDLSAFKRAGGRMLSSQGWADAYNPAVGPINHLADMKRAVGGEIADWFNLFMVPGGGHCGPSSATNHAPASFDMLSSLVEWVEKDTRPNFVVSTEPKAGNIRSRKLCPWPQTAKYLGGDSNIHTSFKCHV